MPKASHARGMVKPVSLRLEDADVRKARPCVYLVRAASATLRSFITGATPTNAAEKMFGSGDVVTDFILRAASAPAEIAVAGWAQEIARVSIYDLIQSITSISAAAEVISRGLKLNMDGIGTIRVPGRIVNPAAAGAWIAEGNPAPARALSFSNAAILQPRRLSVLYPYSREQAESSNIENIVRQTMGEASGLALDAQMFSANHRRHAIARGNGRPAETPRRPRPCEKTMYRTNENGAQAPAADMDPAPSEGEQYPPLELLYETIAQFVSVYVHKKLAGLRRDIVKLKKQLDMVHDDIEADRANGIEVYCRGVETRLASLEGENIRLKATLEARNHDRAKRRA